MRLAEIQNMHSFSKRYNAQNNEKTTQNVSYQSLIEENAVLKEALKNACNYITLMEDTFSSTINKDNK